MADEITTMIAQDDRELATWRREIAETSRPGDADILANMRRDYAAAKAEFEALQRGAAAVSPSPVKMSVFPVFRCLKGGKTNRGAAFSVTPL